MGVGVASVVLRHLEVVECVVVVPSSVPEGSPVVKVTPVAPYIHHAIGGGPAAYHPCVGDDSLLWENTPSARHHKAQTRISKSLVCCENQHFWHTSGLPFHFFIRIIIESIVKHQYKQAGENIDLSSQLSITMASILPRCYGNAHPTTLTAARPP